MMRPIEQVLVRRVGRLADAVYETLDFLDYDFTDKRIWVKPNLLGPHQPEHGATTDPELVRAVVRELKHRGAAGIVVTDNPGGRIRGGLAAFIASTGVPAASEGCFRGLDRTPASLPLQSRFVRRVPVARTLFECDLVLNLPVFKTHSLTILTGAIKNLFGIIPGDYKSTLHGKAGTAARFAELLVDIYQAVPIPMLHIMDALRGMDGQQGPGGGRVLSIGKLLAARNGVALDAVMALMAGTKPSRIPMLRIAGERGLGPIDPADIDIHGDFETIRGFRLPATGMTDILTMCVAVLFPLLRREPVLNRGLCTKCGRCAEVCSAHAIRLNPWPVVDRKQCISCFCCAEMCPTNAMIISTARRALWNRVTGR
jgi:uncharacterized protein (DUF362 family)/NAD-dependent dihydropyrimidine dehydrogenase PreA subunit